MVVGTLSVGAKRSNQWMQYAVDTMEIVISCNGDIVFGAKRSIQWMQWIQ